jgi:hypothetical protein
MLMLSALVSQDPNQDPSEPQPKMIYRSSTPILGILNRAQTALNANLGPENPDPVNPDPVNPEPASTNTFEPGDTQ